MQINHRNVYIYVISYVIYSAHFKLWRFKSNDENNTNKYSSIIHQVVMLSLK